jgi:Phage capsid family
VAQRRRLDGFSLAQVLNRCASGHGVVRGELEYEVCAEAAELAKQDHDPQRPIIPWNVLSRQQRDLTVASVTGGGYSVQTSVGDAIDVLRPWSVTKRAGITTLTGLQSNLTAPKTANTSTGYFLSTESTQITGSTVTVGQISLTPKTAGVYIEYSRQLSLQSAQLERFIRNELLRTLGTLVDRAVLNGSGALGQPVGLLNTSGIGMQSGEIFFATWGPGFVVEVNPYDTTNFVKGIIGARILVSCDVAVRHPGAFVVASSVS